MEAIEYLTCKDELQKVFSKTEIADAIDMAKITVRNLTDETEFEHEPEHMKPRELVRDWHTSHVRRYMFRAGKQWETTETAQVQTWRISARYQGLNHEPIIRKLLEKRLKFFKEFKWEIYGMDYAKIETYEIYMKTGKAGSTTSLYVPVDALLRGDVEAIIKRNESYWIRYKTGGYDLNHAEGEKENEYDKRKLKELELTLRVLEKPSTKKLFALMKK